jgi:DNA invertase Pin-like site-specific DNA recombinase
MMGVFAEFERSMIAERVHAGLARARSEGKQAKVKAALAKPDRSGVRKIAQKFGISPGKSSCLRTP